MSICELPDRLAPEPDEHARPAVARLKPAVVDHSRPAGARLHAPRPADLELRREDRDPERAVRARLQALGPDPGPEQAEMDVARPGRSGRGPGRVPGTQRQLREKRPHECLVVERRPDAARRSLDPDPTLYRAATVVTKLPRSQRRPDRQDRKSVV